MRRPALRVATVLLAACLVIVGVASAGALTAKNGGNRGVILFAGDSNITYGASAIDTALTWGTHLNNGYVPVHASRPGATIRTPDCLQASGCTTFDYWKLKVAAVLTKVKVDAIVTNLGIVDAKTKGTPNGPGYTGYGAKIDWLMRVFGSRPVFWTNLPCTIEPVARQKACKGINFALANARSRWPNLKIIDWGRAAYGHHDYMRPGSTNVHFSAKGQAAWAGMVVAALDARFARL